MGHERDWKSMIESAVRSPALRIALGYGLLAMVWILLSDRLIGLLVSDAELALRISTYKGTFFVTVTALLLFALLRMTYGALEDGHAGLMRAEARARQSEQRYRQVLEEILEGCQIMDFEWRYLYLNSAIERHHRRPNSELIGRSFQEIWPEAVTSHPHQLMRRCMEQRIPFREEVEFTFPDGGIGWYDLRGFPVQEGIVVLSIELTEQRLAEMALKRDNEARRVAEQAALLSEARMRTIFDNEPECVKIVSVDDQVVEMNAAGLALIEAEGIDQVRGRPVMPMVLAEDRPVYEALHARACAGETGIASYRVLGLKGTERWLESHATPLRGSDGTIEAVLSVSRDITDRLRAEAAERRSHALLRAVADNVPVALYVKDTELRYVYLNRHAQELVRAPMAQILGRRAADLLTDDTATAATHHDRAVLDGDSTVAWEQAHSVGGEVRHFLVTKAPFRDADGNSAGIITLAQDISERRRMELALQQSMQALAAHNRELQEFAFVASHDLQEPLRKIRLFADAIVNHQSSPLPADVADRALRMQRAAQRMQELIDDLLSYSRVVSGGQPFSRVDLAAVCASVVDDFETDMRNIGATISVAPLPSIEADPTQMRQVFANLIGNALKFSRKEVPPGISIDAETIADGAQSLLRLTVTDNGIGFDAKHAERILLPFERLHGVDEYPGTGLGLSIVRRIVERHHGRITASGAPGQGARFVIELPLRQPADVSVGFMPPSVRAGSGPGAGSAT